MSTSKTVNTKVNNQGSTNKTAKPKAMQGTNPVRQKKTHKKKKKLPEEVMNKGLKTSTGFVFNLLINIIILFFIVKLFSFAFNFAYDVFGECVYNPSITNYKVVEIPADSSIMEIGKTLEDDGIIESKYVFYVKVKVKGYGSKIQAGKYGLSASMNLDEILNIICQQNVEKTGED